MPNPRPLIERLYEKVSIEPDGCWLFTGALSCGYGRLTDRMANVYAHRFTWELAHGPIPSGYDIDHLCGRRNCVKTSHMRLLSHAEHGRHSAFQRWEEAV